MADYIAQLTSDLNFFRQEAEELVSKFETDAYLTNDGVVRWISNDRVPPQDILELWQHVGFKFDIELSVEKRNEDMFAFIADMKKAHANRSDEQKAEERANARAAFGPGVKIANIFTGETFRT